MWQIKYTATFLRQYSKLDAQIRLRVDSAIKEIELSDDPVKLGVLKTGPL